MKIEIGVKVPVSVVRALCTAEGPEVEYHSHGFVWDYRTFKRGDIVLARTPDDDHVWQFCKVTSVKVCPFTGDPIVRVRDNECSYRPTQCVRLTGRKIGEEV